MISLKDVYKARDRIEPFIYRTPLIQSEYFDKEFNASFYFKLENLQITHAFKVRGSSNKILQLSEHQKKRGIITASSGNHAQGVAYIAKQLNVHAVVVMPKSAPDNKVQQCKYYGANILIKGEHYDDSCTYAKKLAQQEKMIFIPSFDDEQIIAGNGTIALEIFEAIKDVDVIIVPIGGGGLISGISYVAKRFNPNIHVIGVEPLTAPSMSQSLQYGAPIELKSLSTIADGIAVKKVGNINYPYAKMYMDSMVLVSDKEMQAAVNLYWDKLKLVVEAAGAASLAAAIKVKESLQNKKVVSIVSGGNIDKDLYFKFM